MIGQITDFVALHRDRYVFAVKLGVVKISGIGEDTVFLGIAEVGWLIGWLSISS